MYHTALVALPQAHQNIGKKVFSFSGRKFQLHPDETHKIDSWQVFHQQYILFIGLVKLPKLVDIWTILERSQDASFFRQHSNASR